MRSILPAATALLATLMATTGAGAQVLDDVPPPHARPDAPASAEESSAHGTRREWEGAIGLNLSHRPEYSGAGLHVTKASPAFYLRWGRFSLTNASGFISRRSEDVVRGLGLDLADTGRLRASLALRVDQGRGEGGSEALAGTGDIKPTVRLRLNLGWKLDGPWRLGGSWSVDAFGRGGGHTGDISLGWEQPLDPRTRLTVNLSLAAAGDRYMQTWYGITPEQSARSGYAVYTPPAGWRDVTLGASLRRDLGDRWVWQAAGQLAQLLGPAADSPLTRRTTTWGVGTGLVWRF